MTRKHIIFIVLGLAVAAGLTAGGYLLLAEIDRREQRPIYSAEWERCEPDEACVAVPAPCRDWAAVNEKYRDSAAAYYNHLMDVIESTELWCPSKTLSSAQPFAFCLSGQCSLGGQ